jgi:hypothetical protein
MSKNRLRSPYARRRAISVLLSLVWSQQHLKIEKSTIILKLCIPARADILELYLQELVGSLPIGQLKI